MKNCDRDGMLRKAKKRNEREGVIESQKEKAKERVEVWGERMIKGTA